MRPLLIAALGVALLAACSSTTPSAPPPATPASHPATSQAGSALPEGVYRSRPFTWNDMVAAIKAAGFTAKDAAGVRHVFEFDKTVVFTLKLQGGQWTVFESDDRGPDQVGDLGTYTVTGDVLNMTSNSVNAHQRLKWALDGEVLSFKLLPDDPLSDEPDSVAVYTSGPFYRQR